MLQVKHERTGFSVHDTLWVLLTKSSLLQIMPIHSSLCQGHRLRPALNKTTSHLQVKCVHPAVSVHTTLSIFHSLQPAKKKVARRKSSAYAMGSPCPPCTPLRSSKEVSCMFRLQMECARIVVRHCMAQPRVRVLPTKRSFTLTAVVLARHDCYFTLPQLFLTSKRSECNRNHTNSFLSRVL